MGSLPGRGPEGGVGVGVGGGSVCVCVSGCCQGMSEMSLSICTHYHVKGGGWKRGGERGEDGRMREEKGREWTDYSSV